MGETGHWCFGTARSSGESSNCLFGNCSGGIAFGNGGGRELYDHEGDYGADMDAASDVLNLANKPEHAALVKNLSAQLHAHFNGDHF